MQVVYGDDCVDVSTVSLGQKIVRQASREKLISVINNLLVSQAKGW
jgi:hypothetical protein